MKKKKIEAVPWIRPEKMRIGKKIRFVAAADTVEIGGDTHLIVDIWQKGKYGIPLLRAAYTKTDWALQYPQERIQWTREKINGRDYYADNERKAFVSVKGNREYAERTNTEISQQSAEKIYQ